MACKAEVFAPESTRALMVGIPNSGKEHHSSLPSIILFCNIYKSIKNLATNSRIRTVLIREFVAKKINLILISWFFCFMDIDG